MDETAVWMGKGCGFSGLFFTGREQVTAQRPVKWQETAEGSELEEEGLLLVLQMVVVVVVVVVENVMGEGNIWETPGHTATYCKSRKWDASGFMAEIVGGN